MEKVIYYTWEEYLARFNAILGQSQPAPPYDNPDYFNYLKLNRSRQNRWLKTGEIAPTTITALTAIKEPQDWIVITEPWCGDAAHSIPFIKLIADQNPHITMRFVWRDEPPFLIEQYLTNEGKAVPKLIARNAAEEDLFTWGPRPKTCQELFYRLRDENADFERMKVELQEWYNADRGKLIQEELSQLVAKSKSNTVE